MRLPRWLIVPLRRRAKGGPGAQDADNLEPDSELEGNLEPNTAALMEGAPPAGAGGRVQPAGTSPDPRPARGPAEGEIQNMPG
jgi:hypothetical protein